MLEPPKLIESFDISHMQGTDTVASMVVWETGRMKKSDYRKFIIRGEVASPSSDAAPIATAARPAEKTNPPSDSVEPITLSPVPAELIPQEKVEILPILQKL